MSTTQEATVNPDGSTTFESTGGSAGDSAGDAGGSYSGGGEGEEGMPPPEGAEETAEAAEEMIKGIDPAFYLIGAVIVVVLLYYFFVLRRKSSEDEDDFFSNMDCEKFDLKLPTEVDEYYKVKSKCEANGWQPGQKPPDGPAAAAANSPHRILAQALMKRAMADIPIVQHIQRESNGMNRLYAQSMCSVKQWRAYQAAESLVSSEVDDVRAEADEIEPGWGQMIWRQAMQYHQMLKQRHEQEAKAQEEAAKKQKAAKNAAKKKTANNTQNGGTSASAADKSKQQQQPKSKEEIAKAKELAAEKAAQELLKMEEREKDSKKAFKSGGMKKGFLDKGKKK